MRDFANGICLHFALLATAVLWPHETAKPLDFPPTHGTHLLYVARVIDGDTFEAYYLVRQNRFRLHGCNAPEIRDLGGPEARDALAAMLKPGRLRTVELRGQDKFGGVLARPRDDDGRDVVANLVAAGHAVWWDGIGPRP